MTPELKRTAQERGRAMTANEAQLARDIEHAANLFPASPRPVALRCYASQLEASAALLRGVPLRGDARDAEQRARALRAEAKLIEIERSYNAVET